MHLCDVDQRGVICQVEVAPPYRRRCFATVLLAAAFQLGSHCHWSTTDIGKSLPARAFWSAHQLPAGTRLGTPGYCSHMNTALGQPV